MAKTTRKRLQDTEPVTLATMLDRDLPHNLDLERGIIGSILIDPLITDEVITIIRAEDFYADAHQVLYRHLTDMYNSGKTVDITLLVDHLRKSNDMERIGGEAYLAEIIQSVAVPSHAVSYAKEVRDKALLRGLIHASSTILSEAYEPEIEAEKLVSSAEERIFAVHDQRSSDSLRSLEEVVEEVWLNMITQFKKGESSGLPSGFYGYDKKTRGFHPGELAILAARPSMGKTAMALNIADFVGVETRKPVLLVNLEMTRDELVFRILCSRAQLDATKIRSGQFGPDEETRLTNASSLMMKAPIFIDDTPTRTVAEIAAIARRVQKKHGLELIIIDYLQLIEPDNYRDPRQEQVAKIARRLKGLARELKIPVLCLAQLNRQTDGSSDHRPRLSQLRESGAIEQDADVVMFVHREEYYHQGDDKYITEHKLEGMAELIIAKQRNGPTGPIKLQWVSGQTRFYNVSGEIVPSNYPTAHKESINDFSEFQ